MSNTSSDDESHPSISELKTQIKSLHNQLTTKNDLVSAGLLLVSSLKEELEEARKVNENLNKRLIEAEELSSAQITSIPSDVAAKSLEEVDRSSEGESSTGEVEEDPEDEDFDLSSKLNAYFKLWKNGKVTRSEFTLHTVNACMSLYHLMFSDEELAGDHLIALRRGEDSSDSSDKMKSRQDLRASKVAVHYTMEFLKQLMDPRVTVGPEVDEESEEAEEQRENHFSSYPMQWLLSMFPFIPLNNQNTPVDSNAFLPLHLMLALDTSHLPYSDYLSDLQLLIEQHKHSAFQEEVSPLSVAVAKKSPNIEAVQLLLSLHPSSVCTEDEDGSLPLMHACSCNTHTDVIDVLARAYPQALRKGDNFGCCAIHYAAYSGCSSSVAYLLEALPESASLVEGNGALALHDAVQNHRLSDESDFAAPQDVLQMVELLLAANPKAASTRDDFGAFPLHKAAKCASLEIVQVVYEAFPKAIFAVDSEGLLPMHYYSQREKKNIEVVHFMLKYNPHSLAVEEAQLASFIDPNASPSVTNTSTAAAASATQQAGTWGRVKALWASASGNGPPVVTVAPAAAPLSAGAAGAQKVNRRKSSVMGKSGVHMQYKR